MKSSPIRIVIPMDVIGDEILSPVEADRAAAQRAEIHVGLSDQALAALAVRSVYPRRPLWRRIIARIGGAR
jgi:hypothetical protein